jgi:mono/diheme cytochrome c family protein
VRNPGEPVFSKRLGLACAKSEGRTPPARLASALSGFSAGAGACALALVALACEAPPSPASLSEWTPADHHSTDDDKLAAQPNAADRAGQGAVAPAGRRNPSGDVAQLVDITWRQQCTQCHGSGGKGDGQMGPMVRAPDLTRADWQKGVTDAELAATIKNGKNRMPKFDLPEAVLQGLVKRIRALQEP